MSINSTLRLKVQIKRDDADVLSFLATHQSDVDASDATKLTRVRHATFLSAPLGMQIINCVILKAYFFSFTFRGFRGVQLKAMLHRAAKPVYVTPRPIPHSQKKARCGDTYSI